MKKMILAWILGIGLVLGTAGCAEQTKTVDVNAAASAMAQQISFSEKLTEIDKQTACGLYDLPEDQVLECRMAVGSGATVDELAVFLMKDADGLRAANQKALARIAETKKNYQSYRPSEVPKLDGAIVQAKGTCLIVCITADAKAGGVVNGCFK